LTENWHDRRVVLRLGMRAALCGLLFVAGCTCGEKSGEAPAELTDPTQEPAEGEPGAGQEPERSEQGDRFQVYGYDLAPYGAARGTWRSVEMDGSEILRRAETSSEGDARITGARNGEVLVTTHVVGGMAYTVRNGRCRAISGDTAAAVQRLPRLLPLSRLPLSVYGFLGEGVPEGAAAAVEGEPPEGGLAVAGRTFEYDGETSTHRVAVKGEVWSDAEGRPVRSGGTLELTPRLEGESPATARWEFAVEAGKGQTVAPPPECSREVEHVAAMATVPRLQGHQVLGEAPGNVIYRVRAIVADAVALYRDSLPKQGWTEDASEVHEHTGTLVFVREGERLKMIAKQKGDDVTVILSLAR
jgi:hypothetical protein